MASRRIPLRLFKPLVNCQLERLKTYHNIVQKGRDIVVKGFARGDIVSFEHFSIRDRKLTGQESIWKSN